MPFWQNFVPNCPVDNKLTLIQVLVWSQTTLKQWWLSSCHLGLFSIFLLTQLSLLMSENGAHSEQAHQDHFLSTVLGVCSWSQSSLTHDGLSCSEIGLKTNGRSLVLQKNNYSLYDISKRTYFGSNRNWVPVHCRNLMWHDKRDDTNASPMTSDTSRYLMTETSQLNRHDRGSTENNFGGDCVSLFKQSISVLSFHSVCLFKYYYLLLCKYEGSFLLPWSLLAICSFQAHVCGTLCKTENGWAHCELSASKEWANTEQAQPEQGHRKRAQALMG